MWVLCSLLLTLELVGSSPLHLGTHTQVPGQAAVTSQAARTPPPEAIVPPWPPFTSGQNQDPETG